MTSRRLLMLALIGLVLLAGLLVIFHIWGIMSDGVLLFRLLGTIGVLVLICAFLLVVGDDFGVHKKLRDENYLD